MKAGLFTTEFWLTVITLICATVVLATGDIDADKWLFVVGGASGVYNISRGVAKINPPKE
jgi:hypothetical protein